MKSQEKMDNVEFKDVSEITVLGLCIEIVKTECFDNTKIKAMHANTFSTKEHENLTQACLGNADIPIVYVKTNTRKLISLFDCKLRFAPGDEISIRYKSCLVGAHVLYNAFKNIKLELEISNAIFPHMCSFDLDNIKVDLIFGNNIVIDMRSESEIVFDKFMNLLYDIYRLLYVLIGGLEVKKITANSSHAFYCRNLLKYQYRPSRTEKPMFTKFTSVGFRSMMIKFRKVEKKTSYLLHWFYSVNSYDVLDIIIPVYVQCIEGLYNNYFKTEIKRDDINVLSEQDKAEIKESLNKHKDKAHFMEYLKARLDAFILPQSKLEEINKCIESLDISVIEELRQIVSNYGKPSIKDKLKYFICGVGRDIFCDEINADNGAALIKELYSLRQMLSHASDTKNFNMKAGSEPQICVKLRTLIRAILTNVLCEKGDDTSLAENEYDSKRHR